MDPLVGPVGKSLLHVVLFRGGNSKLVVLYCSIYRVRLYAVVPPSSASHSALVCMLGSQVSPPFSLLPLSALSLVHLISPRLSNSELSTLHVVNALLPSFLAWTCEPCGVSMYASCLVTFDVLWSMAFSACGGFHSSDAKDLLSLSFPRSLSLCMSVTGLSIYLSLSVCLCLSISPPGSSSSSGQTSPLHTSLLLLLSPLRTKPGSAKIFQFPITHFTLIIHCNSCFARQ
jgi:hypothetical protein